MFTVVTILWGYFKAPLCSNDNHFSENQFKYIPLSSMTFSALTFPVLSSIAHIHTRTMIVRVERAQKAHIAPYIWRWAICTCSRNPSRRRPNVPFVFIQSEPRVVVGVARRRNPGRAKIAVCKTYYFTYEMHFEAGQNEVVSHQAGLSHNLCLL